MKVTLKIKRFNPEGDAKPHWETYALEVDPTDRLLDALHQVKWFHDGTWRCGARAPTAFAAQTTCALTAATGWPARC